MQGYSKGSKGPFITVDYNDNLEAYMQGYNKCSKVPFITFHYNG
jgi:hypothetical protein